MSKPVPLSTLSLYSMFMFAGDKYQLVRKLQVNASILRIRDGKTYRLNMNAHVEPTGEKGEAPESKSLLTTLRTGSAADLKTGEIFFLRNRRRSEAYVVERELGHYQTVNCYSYGQPTKKWRIAADEIDRTFLGKIEKTV